jgi:hypothetical protein
MLIFLQSYRKGMSSNVQGYKTFISPFYNITPHPKLMKEIIYLWIILS